MTLRFHPGAMGEEIPDQEPRRRSSRVKVPYGGPDFRVDHVRPFDRSYELAPTGHCYGLEETNGWERGTIYRQAVPVWSPPEWIPMYDPTIPGATDPNQWRGSPDV